MGDSVHNKLKLLRVTRDLTQEELAEALGVTRHTIMAIENRRYLPSIALALRVAQYFGLPLEQVFWLEEEAD